MKIFILKFYQQKIFLTSMKIYIIVKILKHLLLMLQGYINIMEKIKILSAKEPEILLLMTEIVF